MRLHPRQVSLDAITILSGQEPLYFGYSVPGFDACIRYLSKRMCTVGSGLMQASRGVAPLWGGLLHRGRVSECPSHGDHLHLHLPLVTADGGAGLTTVPRVSPAPGCDGPVAG